MSNEGQQGKKRMIFSLFGIKIRLCYTQHSLLAGSGNTTDDVSSENSSTETSGLGIQGLHNYNKQKAYSS